MSAAPVQMTEAEGFAAANHIRVAIFDRDNVGASVLLAVFASLASVERVELMTDAKPVLDALSNDTANTLVIDIFSVGVGRGLQLIEEVRRRFPYAPICLTGTIAQLNTLPNVPEDWRARFAHYYKLPKDQTPENLSTFVQLTVEKFTKYLTTKRAATRLRELQVRFASEERPIRHEDQKEISQTLDVAARALESGTPAATPLPIIPGFDDESMKDVITSTIQQAATSLHRATYINTGVLVVGTAMVLTSFVVATITGSSQAVAFGGIGIAGVIASLITNPLRTIGNAAQRLVQVQIGYLSFLSQLQLLNRATEGDDADTPVERSKQLADVTTEMLKTLKDHVGDT